MSCIFYHKKIGKYPLLAAYIVGRIFTFYIYICIT